MLEWQAQLVSKPNNGGVRSVTVRTQTQTIAAYVIAIVMIAAAALGLLYNAGTFTVFALGGLEEMHKKIGPIPHFNTAFCVMTAICVSCYIGLILASIGLIRASSTAARVLSMILLFEVLYFFAVGTFWRDPSLGMSVAAATGIANGGMMVQFIALLPIIIPIALACFGLYRLPKEEQTEDVSKADEYTG